MTRHIALVLLLSLSSAACDVAEQEATPQAGQPCSAAPSDATGDRDGEVVVRGEEAPCGVTFVPVQTLAGSTDGTLPRPPVTAGPGGRWLTGTYTDGEFAVWSPSGDLERLIGMGSGDGPGEFGQVSDLIVDSVAGTVHVFSNSSRVEIYTLDGEYLDGVRLPSPAVIGARLSDGTIVTSTGVPSGSPRILVVEPDTVFRTGPARRMPMPPEVRAGGEGVWTAESPWYQFDRLVLPGGEVDFTIRREVSWFPALSDEDGGGLPGPLVLGFTVDPERRRVFARVMQVEDPDAPAALPSLEGTGERLPRPMTVPPDGFIEAFTFDGDLLASTRYDDHQEMPMPIGGGAPGNLWFRLTGETQSIEILRPELVPN